MVIDRAQGIAPVSLKTSYPPTALAKYMPNLTSINKSNMGGFGTKINGASICLQLQCINGHVPIGRTNAADCNGMIKCDLYRTVGKNSARYT